MLAHDAGGITTGCILRLCASSVGLFELVQHVAQKLGLEPTAGFHGCRVLSEGLGGGMDGVDRATFELGPDLFRNAQQQLRAAQSMYMVS